MNKIIKVAVVNFIILSSILSFGCCGNKKAEQAKAKACASAIKALSAGVDLYNMDSFDKKVEPIRKLDENSFKLLVEKGYIKKENLDVYKCPLTNKFDYESTYDLFEPPVTEKIESFTGIKCKNHGTLLDINKLLK